MHGCSSRTSEASGHPGAKLYRGLAYTGPVSGDGSSTSRCCPWPHSELGVETQHEKEGVVARPDNHVPGGGVGLNNDVGTIVSQSYRVHPGDGSRIKLGHSITVKQLQRLQELMAAASNVIICGLLYIRPLQ